MSKPVFVVYKQQRWPSVQADPHLWCSLSAKCNKPKTLRFKQVFIGPDKPKNKSKIVIIFLSISLNVCYWCSKETSHWDGSFEYPQHMVWLRNKKNNYQIHSCLEAWVFETLHIGLIYLFGLMLCIPVYSYGHGRYGRLLQSCKWQQPSLNQWKGGEWQHVGLSLAWSWAPRKCFLGYIQMFLIVV